MNKTKCAICEIISCISQQFHAKDILVNNVKFENRLSAGVEVKGNYLMFRVEAYRNYR